MYQNQYSYSFINNKSIRNKIKHIHANIYTNYNLLIYEAITYKDINRNQEADNV